MTHPTKPFFVIAMHAIDGQVLLGEFDTEAERDRLFRAEHRAWRNGGMDGDVVDVCRGEVGRMPGRGKGAEEAGDFGSALVALLGMGATGEEPAPRHQRSGGTGDTQPSASDVREATVQPALF